MEEKRDFTAREVLQFTVNILSGIMVPVALNEQICVPVQQAIGNLNALLERMDNRGEAAPEDADPEENEPEDPAIREEDL